MKNGYKYVRVDVFSPNNFPYISTISITYNAHKIEFTKINSLKLGTLTHCY